MSPLLGGSWIRSARPSAPLPGITPRRGATLLSLRQSFLAGCTSSRSSRSFSPRWPEINVRLVLADRNLHLIDDHIDIAVRIGALAESALTATKVGSVRRVVCSSPAYFAAHGVPKRPEDLSALSAVTFDPLSFAEDWLFPDPKSKRELRVPIRSRLSVNTAEAAIDAAAAGVGVTRVLSYQVAQPVLDGRIEIVLADREPEPAPVSLIHAGQGSMPLRARMLLDFAAPRLRARLG